MATDVKECRDRKHQHEMMQAFMEMVTSQQFSDVVLRVEKETFSCHKVILAATCPYFRGMFSSPFTENQAKEVHIKAISASTMRYLIEYIYTGQVVIDTENAQDLISAADMFQLDSLKEMCSDFLQEQLRTFNCLGFWNLARQLNIPVLEQKAWACMTSFFGRVIEGEELLDLNVADLCQLLSSPSLRVPREEVVCKAALSWIQYKPDRKQQHLKTVLANIHLDELKPAFIKTTLMQHPLVKNSPYCKRLFQGIMDYLTMNMPCPGEVSLLPMRRNTGTRTGILLLGGKVGNPMNRIHTFSLVNLKSPAELDGEPETRVQPMGTLPTVHKYSAACCQGNTVYLAGMGADMQEVWKYDNSGTWTKCSSLAYSRTGLTLTSGYMDTLYAVGGADTYIGSGPCQNVSWIEEYNITENTWTPVGQLQIPVCYHTAAFYMGKIFVMGGFMRDTKACDKIQMFDTQTHANVKLEMRLPKPMAYGKGLVVREHIVVVDKQFTLVFSGADLLKEVNSNEDRGQQSAEEEREGLTAADPAINERIEDEEGDTTSSEVEDPPSCSSHSPVPSMEDDAAESPIITQSEGNTSARTSGTTQQDVQPSTSTSQPELIERLEPAHSPVHSFYPYCRSYMVKRGCGVELVAAECLGDQLIVFGGRQEDRNPEQGRILSKAIRACSLNDCLSLGNQVQWRVIGQLDQPTVVFMSAKFKVNRNIAH